MGQARVCLLEGFGRCHFRVGLEMSRLTMDRRSCARLALRPCSPLLSDVQRSRSQGTLGAALSKTLPDFGLRRSPMPSVTPGVSWANSRAWVGTSRWSLCCA